MRVKLRWSGFNGGPGYSIFHFQGLDNEQPSEALAQTAVGQIEDFAGAILNLVPKIVTLQVMPDVEVIDETNGDLTDVLSATPGPAVTGNASSFENYASASGAVVTWRTAGIRNGRRVRGRTFLVPLTSSAYAPDGSLADSALTALNTASAAMVGSFGGPVLGVFARPTGPAAVDGIFHPVRSHSINDKVAILRSRRD
jgi:hypothetical protein